jgi:hypothetical protein
MRLTIWIDEDLAPALKMRAVEERRRVADQAAIYVEQALQLTRVQESKNATPVGVAQ